MAHVTLQLICYRLGEAGENMAELYNRFTDFYAEFSWSQVDFVDAFFVSWILFGIVAIALVHVYFKLFGWRSFSGGGHSVTELHSSPPKKRLPLGPVESCQWLNSIINWVYLNYNSTPEYVNAWLKGLNDQAKKFEGATQIRFDRILAGSLPPRLTNIHTETGPKDNFTLRGVVDASELGFQVLVSEQTTSHVQLTNCDINVHLLKGELNVQTVLTKEDVHVFVRFEGEPEIVLLIKPHPKAEGDPQTKADLEHKVDVRHIEEVVKKSLSNSITHFKLHTSQFDADICHQVVASTVSQNHVPLSAPPKPPRTPEALLRQDKRLLVKVIKASGLGAKDIGCNDPYCTVEMDDPPQRHTTSVVKNAVNPFWDESFLFDIIPHSRELLFEVFDRDKPPGDDFLGMAAVNVEELRRNPSSRHMIPLAGRQPGTGKGGNITVEVEIYELQDQFLFMDPAELPDIQQDERELMLATVANLSPRRRIETKRTVMPGGLIVTTQTTTIERAKEQSAMNESPVQPERFDTSLEQPKFLRSSVDSSPRSTRYHSGPIPPTGVVVRDYGEKSATLPNKDTKPLIPEIKMTVSTPTEELKEDGQLSSTTSDKNVKPKRSTSLASTLRRRFIRGGKKPRSHSADRASGRNEDQLRPTEQYASGSKATEDIDTMEPIPGQANTTNLKKSKSLGSSLKKLFKGRRKHSRGQADGDQHVDASSRESSVSRSRTGRLSPEKTPADEGSSYQASPSPHTRRITTTPRHSTSSAV